MTYLIKQRIGGLHNINQGEAIMKDESTFPFVEVPEYALKYVGYPYPEGSRLYRFFGRQEKDGMIWYDAINEICQCSLVSPGGAAGYVGVSRPAVHKRLKEGRLTAFLYYDLDDEDSYLLGKDYYLKNPKNFIQFFIDMGLVYTGKLMEIFDGVLPSECYIPIKECTAWAIQLDKYYDRSKEFTEEEWRGTFLKMPQKLIRELKKKNKKK